MNSQVRCFAVGFCKDRFVSFSLVIDRSYNLESCERFEPRSHFKSRLSMIVRVNVVLNRTVVDSD